MENTLTSRHLDDLRAFSENTRVWIYQSLQPLDRDQQELVHAEAVPFCNTWNAHGSKIKCGVFIWEDRFIVIAADQEVAQNSGCSIDSSVAFVKTLEKKLSLDLMNRMLISFQSANGVRTAPLQELPALYSAGEITDETLVFNPLADTKPAIRESWLTPFGLSWQYRFRS